jgi:hypothetical protein
VSQVGKSALRPSQKPWSEGVSGTNPADLEVVGQCAGAHLPHICLGALRSVAIDLVVSGMLDDRRIRKQFRGAPIGRPGLSQSP